MNENKQYLRRGMVSIGLILFMVMMVAPVAAADSQAPAIDWLKCIGGSELDQALCIEQTTDSGYIFCGVSESTDGDAIGNHGGKDAWVVKTDAEGSPVWHTCLGGTGSENARDIHQTADGGYIVAGDVGSIDGEYTVNHGGTDAWVAKLNADGAVMWQKCIGGTYDERINRICQVSDGGYIFAGYTNSVDNDIIDNHNFNDDGLVGKLDSEGNILWLKCIGGEDSDYLYGLCETSDKGYVVTGYARSTDDTFVSNLTSGFHGGDYDAWAVKLGSDGTVEWQNCFGGSSLEQLMDVVQVGDGGYVAVGYTRSNDGDVSGHYGANDAWLIKFDSDGTLLSQKCLGGTSYDYAYDLVATADGGYAFTGSIRSSDGIFSENNGFYDLWVVKTDVDGTLAWQKCIGGSDRDSGSSLFENADGSLTVAGYTKSTNGDISTNLGNGDAVVVKLVDGATPVVPKADFSADVTSGTLPLTVSFTDLSTAEGINYRSWSFENDSPCYSNKQNPVHTYTEAGTYTVELTVRDKDYKTYTEVKENFIVVVEPPKADFSANVTSGTLPLTVSFTDLSTVEGINYRSWSFENDSSCYSSEQNPVHTYTEAGTYTVELTVRDNNYKTYTEVKESFIIVVEPPVVPKADFSANVTSGTLPLTVSFTDLSTAEGINYRSWSFENDSSCYSSEQNPVHTYTEAGTYTVELTVRDKYGKTFTEVKENFITIEPSEKTVWYVDDDGGYDFTDIQSALNVAADGNTIYVFNGTYATEDFGYGRPNVSVIGEGADVVCFDFMGTFGVSMPAGGGFVKPNSTGCSIEGITVINSTSGLYSPLSPYTSDNVIRNCVFDGMLGDVGLQIGSSNCLFENNVVKNGVGELTGMIVPDLLDSKIVNNTFSGNTGAGMAVCGGSDNNVISGNTFSSNACAGLIFLEATGMNNRVYFNEFTGNGVVATIMGPAPENVYWTSVEELAYTYKGVEYTGYLGNYYDDYTGTDADGDGIGDTPYTLPDGLGNDTAPLMGTIDHYTITGVAPEHVTAGLSFTPNSAEIGVGETVEVAIVIDEFTTGLSGYNLTVTLDDASVAEVTAVSFPDWAGINENGTLPSGSVWIKAADLSDGVSAGAADVTLTTLTISGLDGGSANITATVSLMDDDDGSAIDVTVTGGQVMVSAAPVFPGCENPPHDLNGDGIYEDVNGNGLFDFDDVVTFFNAIEWSTENEPVEAFDVNGNGRIDFDDLVELFNQL